MSFRIISVDATKTPELKIWDLDSIVDAVKQLRHCVGLNEDYAIPLFDVTLHLPQVKYLTFMAKGATEDYYIVDAYLIDETINYFLNLKIESARHGISHKGLELVPKVMKESLPFEVIWQTLKQWVISIPHMYEGELNATGSHVKLILDALAENHLTIKRKD